MNIAHILVLSLMLLCTLVRGSDVSPEVLIERLNSPHFDVRNDAEDALSKLGDGIEPLLERHRRHGSAEVQQACKRLLAELRKPRLNLLTLDADGNAVTGLKGKAGDFVLNAKTGWCRIEQVPWPAFVQGVAWNEHVNLKENCVSWLHRGENWLIMNVDRGATVKGRIVGRDGEPISGAHVTLSKTYATTEAIRNGDVARPWNNDSTVGTDAEGRYTFSNAEPGVFQIQVSCDNFVSAVGEVVRLRPRTQIAAADICLLPKQPCVITGRLLDGRGRPFAHRVFVYGTHRWKMSSAPVPVSPAQFAANPFDNYQPPTVRTGADGSFRIELRDEGVYSLWLYPETSSWNENSIALERQRRKEEELAAAEAKLAAELAAKEEKLAAELVAAEAEDRRRLREIEEGEEAAAAAEDAAAAPEEAAAAPEEAVEAPPPLPPEGSPTLGELVPIIEIDVDGEEPYLYTDLETPPFVVPQLTATPGRETALGDITPMPTGIVQGRLEFKDGDQLSPAQEVAVTLLLQDDARAAGRPSQLNVFTTLQYGQSQAITQSDGRWVMPRVPAGRYTLIAMGHHYFNIEVKAGQTTDVGRIELPKPPEFMQSGVFEGYVIDDAGNPLQGARVGHNLEFNAGDDGYATDERGRFQCAAYRSCPAGAEKNWLLVSADGFETRRVPVDPQQRNVGAIRLKALTYHSLRVKVCDEAGEPLEFASVHPRHCWPRAVLSAEAFELFNIGARSEIVFPSLPSGERYVQVAREGYQPQVVSMRLDQDKEIEVRLRRGPEVRIVLQFPGAPRPAEVTVYVPFLGTLLVAPDGGREHSASGVGTRFRVRGLPEGEYTVVVNCPGLVPDTDLKFKIEPGANGVREHIVRLVPACALAIKTDPRQVMQTLVLVPSESWKTPDALLDVVHAPSYCAVVDGTGRAEWHSLRPGEYAVVMTKENAYIRLATLRVDRPWKAADIERLEAIPVDFPALAEVHLPLLVEK
ncbi:MAG TPA: carboxypeptidase regulatory-like domain-containing protein, partial [Planctomycetota bacterium]|nr:carboxypeptidase regulatory-like domain-containing protein [Planctomycetota bacterium]